MIGLSVSTVWVSGGKLSTNYKSALIIHRKQSRQYPGQRPWMIIPLTNTGWVVMKLIGLALRLPREERWSSNEPTASGFLAHPTDGVWRGVGQPSQPRPAAVCAALVPQAAAH